MIPAAAESIPSLTYGLRSEFRSWNSSLLTQHGLTSQLTSDGEMNILISAGVSVGW